MGYLLKEAIDLTQGLANGMPVYPGDPSPSFESYATLEKDGVNLTRLTLGSHTGTHTDAPAHFIHGGAPVDQIPVERLIGEAVTVDLSEKPIGSGITASDLRSKLDGLLREDDFVLCYTGCSELWGAGTIDRSFTYLTEEAAEYLVSRKVRAVGVDYLSVEQFGAKEPRTHVALLSRGVFIIESLSRALKGIVGKRVLLICAPLLLEGRDGAPSRVIAVPISE